MAQDPFAQYAVDDPFAAFATPVSSHESASKTPALSLADRAAGKQYMDPNWTPPTAREVVAKLPETALNIAISEGGGALAGKALQLAGRGLYRAGALPLTQMFGKYGDLVGKGLESGVTVTQGGLKKAGQLKVAAQATKEAAVKAADDVAGFRTQGIADDALARVEPMAGRLRRAGMGDPSKAFQARAGRLVTENGPGMTPSQLEEIKGTVDDTLGGAYKKLRMKEPLSPNEQMSMSISHAAGDAQSSVIPNYRALNKDIMDAEGVRRMIARRLLGNQGLENALTMAIGPSALPARMALLPGVASTAGIAAHRAGSYATPILSKAALLALSGLANEQP